MPKKTNTGKETRDAGARRPQAGALITQESLDLVDARLDGARAELEAHAAHLRTLDRARLNRVGLERQGFIAGAYQLAELNTEFLPHYLPIEKFREDNALFERLLILLAAATQIQELLRNLTARAADTAYTDALEFYASISDAAGRGIDSVESVDAELKGFFKHGKHAGREPTQKELKSDVNALLRGKRSGKIIVENVRPKLTGGRRKVVDKRFDDTIGVREVDDGEENA